MYITEFIYRVNLNIVLQIIWFSQSCISFTELLTFALWIWKFIPIYPCLISRKCKSSVFWLQSILFTYWHVYRCWNTSFHEHKPNFCVFWTCIFSSFRLDEKFIFFSICLATRGNCSWGVWRIQGGDCHPRISSWLSFGWTPSEASYG